MPRDCFWDLALGQAELDRNTQRERLLHAVNLGYGGGAVCYQAKARISNADRRVPLSCSVSPFSKSGIEV